MKVTVTISQKAKDILCAAAVNPSPGYFDKFRPTTPGYYEVDLAEEAAERIAAAALPGETPSETIERSIRASAGVKPS